MLVTGPVRPLEVSLLTNHFVVTPHNSTEFTHWARELYVGVGGDIVLIDADGAQVTYKNFPTGGKIAGLFKRVHATGTLATDIVGRY